MQPTELNNTARRAMDVEDYIDVLRRHRGWIFGPFLFCLVVSVVGVYLWPDTYISRGIIRVEPQQLPTNLVQAIMPQDMIERIQSMESNIKSRDVLTNIISTYNLYPKELSRQPIEETLDQMRRDITIEPLGGIQSQGHTVPAFRVSFSYPNQKMAQQVTSALINRFIDENVKNQSGRAFTTTEFLKDQSDKALKELDDIETRLAAYKMQNNGRLPEQRAENYQKLQSLEAAIGNYTSQIRSAQEQKLFLEGQREFITRQSEERAKVTPEIVAQQQQTQKSQKLLQAEQQLEYLRNELRGLKQRYTDTHPYVKTAQQDVAAAQQRVDEVTKQDAEAAAAAAATKKDTTQKPPVTMASLQETQLQQQNMMKIQQAITGEETAIEDANSMLKRAKEDKALLEARLNSVPQSEKEYDDLRQQLDLKREKYTKMTQNLATGEVQQEMENRKQGETLSILDAASFPESPSYPPRYMVMAVGAGVGLVLGFVIAGAREVKDTSLKNLKDVRAYTQMTILGSIPLLENDFVVRRRRRLAWLGWTTATLAALILMSGSVVYHLSTKQ